MPKSRLAQAGECSFRKATRYEYAPLGSSLRVGGSVSTGSRRVEALSAICLRTNSPNKNSSWAVRLSSIRRQPVSSVFNDSITRSASSMEDARYSITQPGFSKDWYGRAVTSGGGDNS